MSGLRQHRRDVELVARSGDVALSAPSEAQVLEWIRVHLVRPAAPLPSVAHLAYARWKPRVSLTLGYELEYPQGERRWVTAKLYGDGKAREIAQRESPELAGEVVDPWLAESAVLSSRAVHLWAPPFDRALPGLERAFDLRRTKRLLLDLGLFPGRRVRSASSSAELLRYKPERRAVLRLDLKLRPLEGGPKSAETLAARALPEGDAARAIAARSAFDRLAPSDLAPRLEAHESRTGLLLERWLDVRAHGPEDFEHARRAGALLAHLHGLPLPAALASAPTSQDLSALTSLFAAETRLARAATGLLPAYRGSARPVRWSHGDFHPDQVASSRASGALCLLDLDQLGLASPLEDLSSWVADHMAAHPGTTLEDAAAELLEGYVSAGGAACTSSELAGPVAAALVQRAAGGLRRLAEDATPRALRLLEQARAIAPSGALFA